MRNPRIGPRFFFFRLFPFSFCHKSLVSSRLLSGRLSCFSVTGFLRLPPSSSFAFVCLFSCQAIVSSPLLFLSPTYKGNYLWRSLFPSSLVHISCRSFMPSQYILPLLASLRSLNPIFVFDTTAAPHFNFLPYWLAQSFTIFRFCTSPYGSLFTLFLPPFSPFSQPLPPTF